MLGLTLSRATPRLYRQRQFRANRGHSLDRVANGSKRDPKAAIGSGKTCREPPIPRFRLRNTPTRLLARVAENLSESTSRRLLPREVVRCVDRLGATMPADNANSARLRPLYPLLFGESDLGADL